MRRSARPALRRAALACACVAALSLAACSSAASSGRSPSSSPPGPGSSSSAAVPASSSPASPTTASSSATTGGRDVVPVDVVTSEDGDVKPVVRVSVGGGPPAPVVLDTGSSGLLLESKYVGSGARDLGTSVTYQYIGFSLHAKVESAQVSFPGSGDVTTAVSIGSFDSSANSVATSAGAVGILGIAPGNSTTQRPALLSPLAALPGSLADGYTVDLPGKQLILGAPDISGATQIPLTRAGWTYANGLPGYRKTVSLDWTIGTSTARLPTTVDTGAPRGQVASRLVPSAPASAGKLAAGTAVRVAAGGRELLGYTVGHGTVPAPFVSSQQSVMNTGVALFRQHRVGLDLRRGVLVVAK